ncbi:probable rRNA-processing protein EBP2 [Argiope bruennichi]|uniref:probable rRNA-processing protein EBP2 n=1 Tax=Argiope bruennichi TaxID=94029 RepID=UPI002493DF33|nr:probable rRNA-processing protein EBP2 [Argiope bruennichi]XP_055942249.1 probable rRNA-processing protein EBP2 [Argiope bruennichi]
MSDLSDASVENDFVSNIPSIAKQQRKIIPVNNVVGLQEKLKDIQLNMDWIEKLDITVKSSTESEDSDKKAAIDTEAEHDFKREMLFYNQALEGVTKAFKKLKKMGIPTKRPDDYFAEMAKSDAHMLKVREKLLNKQMVVERTEKVRALREQKKQGKKIQREIIESRKREKKQMINALKKTKKGKMDADKLLGEKKGPGKENFKKKKSREFRDSKYGYGGKKKGSKYNTAESSAMHPSKGPKGKKPQFGKQRRTKHRRRR